MDFLQLVIGLVLLVFAGDYLVESASGIARSFKMSNLIIGLTVVAFGTSAPELFVSVTSSLTDSSAIAVGNVVGSNCINVSVIVGLTALICPFAVKKDCITIDTMFMLFITLVLLGLGLFGEGISRFDGFLLFAMLVGYTCWRIKKAKQNPEAMAEAVAEVEVPEMEKPVFVNVLILVASIGFLAFGADLMVEAAKNIARDFGVTERVISVTVVALGTSLPELTTSVMGAIKGKEDLAVGGIVGSNIFNIGSVLALSACASPIGFSEASITTPQFTTDVLWVFGFEVMLLIGLINVTNNVDGFKNTGKLSSLFSAENGLVGRIWGACALGLYAVYVFLLLSKPVVN
ncbi:MAG: calcium/sodium antiporter [Paludibacteraceae bacterium]|nr:calcium/sodium antiporter [Paludibacteraceae bacterium]